MCSALAPPTNSNTQYLNKAGSMAVYVEIPYQESLEKLKSGELTHAAHAMIYAKWPGVLFEKYQYKYAVMVRKKFCDAYKYHLLIIKNFLNHLKMLQPIIMFSDAGSF